MTCTPGSNGHQTLLECSLGTIQFALLDLDLLLLLVLLAQETFVAFTWNFIFNRVVVGFIFSVTEVGTGTAFPKILTTVDNTIVVIIIVVFIIIIVTITSITVWTPITGTCSITLDPTSSN